MAGPVALAHVGQPAMDGDRPAQTIAQPATLSNAAVVSAEHYPAALEIRLLSICSDGESALVVMSEPALDVWPAVLSIWPEIVESVLVVAGLVLVRRTGRRRRTASGVPHCRRCGYIIYGKPSRCSECGTQLTPGGICLGGRASVMLIASITVGVLALVVFPLTRNSLPRRSNWVDEHSQWYSAQLLHVLESLFQFSEYDFIAFPAAVVEFDLKAQIARRTICTADFSVGDVRVWQEGETRLTAFVADMDRVVVIGETRGGRPRVIFRASEDTWPELIGFAANGERLYYYDTSHEVEGVCATDLTTGQVNCVRRIPCNRWRCFGPSGPYFEMSPLQRIAIVYDDAARERGEPVVRMLGLDSGEWLAALPLEDETSIWRANWILSDGGSLFLVNDRYEDASESRSGITVGNYSLNSATFSREIFIPMEDDEEHVLDVQVLTPDAWRITTKRWLDETSAKFRVHQVSLAPDGSAEVSTFERLIYQPADCDPSDWYSNGLRLRGVRVEWELRRYDELGSALLCFDLELPTRH